MNRTNFNVDVAKKWLEWRRHLVMLAAASNDPTYVTDRMFHREGFWVSCPMDKRYEDLTCSDYFPKNQFVQSAQCRGHWFSYFDYRQEIVKGPVLFDAIPADCQNIEKAKKIFCRLRDLLTTREEVPKPTHVFETVNHIDSYRYPSEVFLVLFDCNRELAIDNPLIVLQVTMPLSAQADPTRIFLEEFQTQYIKERFDEIELVCNKDYLFMNLPTLNPASLACILRGDTGMDTGNYSSADEFSKYPLGVVFKIEKLDANSAHVIGDLVALASRMGAANVFFTCSGKVEWDYQLFQRLRSLKYNMKYRPIVGLFTEKAPADPITRQILGSTGFGATKIEMDALEPGLSGADLHLVRYHRNALPTSWKVLKVGSWSKLHDEYRRYQMFVADRVSNIRARFISGPKTVVCKRKDKDEQKEEWKASIEYSLASTLVEDRPESLSKKILEAKREDVEKLRNAIDGLFRRILVSWDSSHRELGIKGTDVPEQKFQEDYQAKNHESHEPDRRPYKALKDEYVPLNLKGKICEKLNDLPKDLKLQKNEIENLVFAIDEAVTIVTDSIRLKSVKTLKVCHGDLHGRNILIDGQGALWVIDFGQTGLHHSLCDFVTLECSIRWWYCMWIDKELFREESDELESDLLKLEYWEHPSLLDRKYRGSYVSKYASILSTIRKHARRFCATELPGFGFPEYLTCLGLKCLTTIRNEPTQYERWCREAQEIFRAANGFLGRFA